MPSTAAPRTGERFFLELPYELVASFRHRRIAAH
jgi:hypothetical protein